MYIAYVVFSVLFLSIFAIVLFHNKLNALSSFLLFFSCFFLLFLFGTFSKPEVIAEHKILHVTNERVIFENSITNKRENKLTRKVNYIPGDTHIVEEQEKFLFITGEKSYYSTKIEQKVE